MKWPKPEQLSSPELLFTNSKEALSYAECHSDEGRHDGMVMQYYYTPGYDYPNVNNIIIFKS